MTVYGRTSSSNTQKVLWALQHVGVGFNLINASARVGNGSNFLTEHTGGTPFGVVGTDAYGQLNPHHQIPTIVDPSTKAVVWESHACVRYVAEQYGLGEPTTPTDRAHRTMWMDWVLSGNDYSPCFGTANHYLIDAVARMPRDPSEVSALTARVDDYIQMYLALFQKADGFFEDEPSFIAAEHLTVADIPLAVELNRFNQCAAVLLDGGGGIVVPALPRLRKWYANVLQLPSFQDAVVTNEMKHHGIEPGSLLEATVRGGVVR
jgi:glutathione S-transferase